MVFDHLYRSLFFKIGYEPYDINDNIGIFGCRSKQLGYGLQNWWQYRILDVCITDTRYDMLHTCWHAVQVTPPPQKLKWPQTWCVCVVLHAPPWTYQLLWPSDALSLSLALIVCLYEFSIKLVCVIVCSSRWVGAGHRGRVSCPNSRFHPVTGTVCPPPWATPFPKWIASCNKVPPVEHFVTPDIRLHPN